MEPVLTAASARVPPVDAVRPSLGNAYRSVVVPAGSFWRKLGACAGPGWLVAVGYMDPGNWATDLAGGSTFGYTLLFVILLSNVMAMILQALAAKLGIVAGRDLAQACADRYGGPVRIGLWILCELAIIACELAEVIGTAIALQLLFGMPLLAGVCLTALNIPLIMVIERFGFRWLEAAILALIVIIGGCLGLELFLIGPDWSAVMAGFVPTAAPLRDPAMLYIAISIIGATVMPHNLYLHSAAVQTRAHAASEAGQRQAIRFATIDSTIALTLALLINAAILILAAATFHGHRVVTDLGQAYHLLSPMLGTYLASVLFGVALLASGQNATVTGTLAGQVVMEGFTKFRISPQHRRLISRLLAIGPALLVAAQVGQDGLGHLLILSQVFLSLQLPFAVVPLVRLTGDKRLMGAAANPRWLAATAWVIAGLLIVLNARLVSDVLL
jgi:manganese transport protein